MIIQKLKICKGCHKPKKIFSHGLCLQCSKTHFKPLKRTPIKNNGVTQKRNDNLKLTQPDAFYKAYLYWEGKNFLTGDKENFNELGPENFHHCLPKGRFKYFKYYPKCIVIISFDAHYVITHGTIQDKVNWIKDHPEEYWDKLDRLFEELKAEYQEWIKFNKNEYKLIYGDTLLSPT